MCVCVCVCVCLCVRVCIHVVVVVRSPNCVSLFATPRTAAFQGSLSMGFFRQEYWSGLPFPSPGDLPDPGIEPMSPALAGGFFTTEPPGKPAYIYIYTNIQYNYMYIGAGVY